jgi:hypothetical protein
MPFLLEVSKTSEKSKHRNGQQDRTTRYPMRHSSSYPMRHPTISVSSVTPPTEMLQAAVPPDAILSVKKATLTPSMATAGLVIAARNDFQVWAQISQIRN